LESHSDPLVGLIRARISGSHRQGIAVGNARLSLRPLVVAPAAI